MNMLLASFIGMVVTIMLTLNSILSVEAGPLPALLIFHVIGVLTGSALLMVSPAKPDSGKIPLYLYAGGVIGVAVVFSNNLCFSVLGASVTLSLGIMGQSLGSILTDTTGFLNMEKHPFKVKKLSGFLLIFTGTLLMVDKWELHTLYILFALVTGMIVILSMILNSRLAAGIGMLKATRMNFLTGLVTVMAIMIFSRSGMISFDTLSGIHPVYIFGGGILGVFIVIGFNYILPKIPTIYTTVLMFLGQIVTGMVIDLFMGKDLSEKTIIGAIVIISGLGVNVWIDRFARAKNRQASLMPS